MHTPTKKISGVTGNFNFNSDPYKRKSLGSKLICSNSLCLYLWSSFPVAEFIRAAGPVHNLCACTTIVNPLRAIILCRCFL